MSAGLGRETSGKETAISERHPSVAGATARALLWSGAAVGAAKLFALVSTLVLVRLLVREEFGVASYALTIAAMLEILRGLGVGQALIFFPPDDKRTQTAFWLSAGGGVLFAALVWTCAPLAGAFFRDARAVPVTRALAPYFLLLGLATVSDVLLRKELKFAVRMVPETARSLVKAVTAIVLALLGYSYWSLIVAQIAGAATYLVVLWRVVPWRPGWSFDRREAAGLLGYGKDIVLIATLALLAAKIDHLVVGRFQGAVVLGVYTVAFQVPDLLLTQSAHTLSVVLFPAFAKLRDRERVLAATLRTVRILTALVLPVAAGLALVARPLVLVGFGTEWADAADVLPWIAALLLLATLPRPIGDAYRALGHTRVLARLTAVTTLLLVPAVVWVAREGGGLTAIVGVMIGVRAVRLVLDLVTARRLLGIRLGRLLRAVAPALVATGLMTGAVLAVRAWAGGASELALLAYQVGTGVLVYCIAMAVLDARLIADLRRLARSAAQDRGA